MFDRVSIHVQFFTTAKHNTQIFDVCAPFNNIVAQTHASDVSIMKWSDN